MQKKLRAVRCLTLPASNPANMQKKTTKKNPKQKHLPSLRGWEETYPLSTLDKHN